MLRGYFYRATSFLAAGIVFISHVSASTSVEVLLHQSPYQGSLYGVGVFFNSTDVSQGQWTSPDGTATGSFSGGNGVVNYMTADSLADLQSLSAQNWNLNVYSQQSSQLVESVYTFSPGISAISQSQVGMAILTAPTDGQVFHTTTPTFQWKAISPFPKSVSAYIYSANPSTYGQNQVIYPVNLNSDGSFTVPIPLTAGLWHLQLNGGFNLGQVPFTATLQSGPDVGISSATASVTDEFDTGADFSIVLPEPGSLTLLAVCLTGLQRHSRRRR